MSHFVSSVSAAEVALERVWPRVRNRFNRHPNRKRLADYRLSLEQEFPRLLDRLTDLYHDQWDLYYHLEQLIFTGASQWLSYTKPPHPYRPEDHRWIDSEHSIGATGYVDLFAGNLTGLAKKAGYLEDLGITYLHLLPFFDVPEGDSDGGYAIRDYGNVNPKVGTIEDLKDVAGELHRHGIRLVLDFVFNHTSDQHDWALKAKDGDARYQNYYWLFKDTTERDAFGAHLRDIFPDKRKGCFTWNDDVGAWVWTTFNSFQWDLNYANPEVFHAMCTEMLKLVDAGADVIRLDALAFTWKQPGTSSENLPKAHTLIQAFNAFLRICAPHVALKSEAIVAPDEVEKYIDPGECPLSYNPNLMALMWEALATRQTRLLINGTRRRTELPNGSAWINYLRCHDDIGWAFADQDAWDIGINPHDHRWFLNQFYTGQFPGSFARGVPFQEDPATGDCRISGTLASLVGLEKALTEQDEQERQLAIQRILMLNGTMIAFKGIPLIYLGDEFAMLNDHTYLDHPDHSDDSRWVHRVAFDDAWLKRRSAQGSIEQIVFEGMQNLIQLRRQHPVFGDADISIEDQFDEHLFMFRRTNDDTSALVVANFSEHQRELNSSQMHSLGLSANSLDLISNTKPDSTDQLMLKPYQLCWFVNKFN